MQLITYADRLGGNLPGLRSLLRNEFEGLFSGVHILPFFDPIDGADAGFDPVDHTRVDARIGDWGDIAAIAADEAGWSPEKTKQQLEALVSYAESLQTG